MLPTTSSPSPLLLLLPHPHPSLHSTLHTSSTFPALMAPFPCDTFCDFELATHAGIQHTWFKLHHDYEAVGDVVHAGECFKHRERVLELWKIGSNRVSSLGSNIRP
ncbi:hypothetical protein K439DRAFT_1623569 [Ramaria rubella]|nr:hypothetical protein K439DRAFT_1623569 [Ramaria rubella]